MRPMTSNRTSRRSTFRRFALMAAALALPATVLTACGGNATDKDGGSNSTSAAATEVTFGVLAAPPSLNPATGDPAYAGTLAWAYDPLIVTAPDGTFAPALAVEWGYVGKDNMAFQLKLREGVKFSDGTALDADAVKTFLDYQRNQKIGSIAALFPTVKSIEATDPSTVLVKFAVPTPGFATFIAQGLAGSFIASPKAVADPTSLDKNTFGAGPYMLEADSTVAGDTYTFVQNPNYWDKSRQHFEKVTVKVISNPSSMVQAMRAGQIQAALGDPTTLAAAEGAGLQVIAPPQALTGLNLMDRAGTLSEPLGDVRVRQALNFAVNREEIAKALFGNEDLALSQYALPGQAGYDETLNETYPYDPEKAKALLEEAGYPDGFTLPTLTVPLAGLDKVTQAIAGQLEEVGVKLDITTKPAANDYFTSMVTGEFPAAAIGYGLSSMAVLNAGFISATGPFNPFKFSDPELDKLLAAYAVAPEESSAEAEKAINARLVDQAWTVPVVGSPLSYYLADGFTGLDATSQNSGVPWLTELRPAE